MKNQILLKKNEERRLLNGHQWIFSNEIASIRGNPEVGDVVELVRHDEKFLGIGFFNPHSLIAFRLLSQTNDDISFDFFEQRIRQADQLRQRLYPNSTAYRMVYGESDFLPGLIVDRYNEFLCLQILSAGIERRLSMICDILESLYHPKALIARNDIPLRALEHLPEEKKVLRGSLDETIIVEDDIKYKVDVFNGQKTGFFFDQRENRKAIRRYVGDKIVLDCFCNEGGFSLHAAAAGAQSVLGIDISETATRKAEANARINHAESLAFETSDVFMYLQQLEKSDKRFDVVILDPPSFTKSKKTIATALKGYKEINLLALQILNQNGILITSSCSHHITEDAFIDLINQSAKKSRRTLQLLEYHGAAADHPVLPSMPETQYLKFAIFAVQ